MQNNFRHASTDDTLNVCGKNLVKQEQVAYVSFVCSSFGYLVLSLVSWSIYSELLQVYYILLCKKVG